MTELGDKIERLQQMEKKKELGIREAVLNDFEAEMISRSSTKVQESAAAAEFLHSEIALHESDQPRGKCRKKEL